MKLEKGKGVEIVCNGEIKILGHGVQDGDRKVSGHTLPHFPLLLKYYWCFR